MPPKRAAAAKSADTAAPATASTGSPSISPFSIPAPDKASKASSKAISCQTYAPKSTPKPKTSAPRLIFTHGAIGGMNSAATTAFASGFSNGAGAPVVVFEGSSNLVSRTKCFSAVLAHAESTHLSAPLPVLGGRSLGARAAVQAAAARNVYAAGNPVAALVLVSYPLTGPSGDVRDRILLDLPSGVDVLFVSGDRDNMCEISKLNEVRGRMQARSWLAVIKGADHGMATKPAAATEARRKASGRVAAMWAAHRDTTRTECVLEGDEDALWVARDKSSSAASEDEDSEPAEKGKSSATKKRKSTAPAEKEESSAAAEKGESTKPAKKSAANAKRKAQPKEIPAEEAPARKSRKSKR